MTPDDFIKWIDQQLDFWNKAFSQCVDDMEKSYINGRLSTFYDMKTQFAYLLVTYFEVTKQYINHSQLTDNETEDKSSTFTDNLD